MKLPEIKKIKARTATDGEREHPYARIGETLILLGDNFSGPNVRAVIKDVRVAAKSMGDHEIELQIPQNEAGLQPGLNPIWIVRDVFMGRPPVAHAGIRSNQFMVTLVPHIKSLRIDASKVPKNVEVSGTRLFSDELSIEALIGHRLIFKEGIKKSKVGIVKFNPTPEKIILPIPDTFPAWPVRCLISGKIQSPVTSLPKEPELMLRIDSDGPHTIKLHPETKEIEDIALAMQNAIRKAEDSGIAFSGARVMALKESLLLVPGGLGSTSLINFGKSKSSEALCLTSSKGARHVRAYLSGELAPFPIINADKPAMMIKAGDISKKLELSSRPASLKEAASLLEEAIKSAGPEQRFSSSMVGVLENQLLIVPGENLQIEFDGVSNGDQKSVAEFQLKAMYRVRIRVNGAESIDEKYIEMP
jgi:hypothetical protein